jgi:hypothetical protein
MVQVIVVTARIDHHGDTSTLVERNDVSGIDGGCIDNCRYVNKMKVTASIVSGHRRINHGDIQIEIHARVQWWFYTQRTKDALKL